MTLLFPRFRHRTVRFLCDFMVAGFLLAKDLIRKRQRQEFFFLTGRFSHGQADRTPERNYCQWGNGGKDCPGSGRGSLVVNVVLYLCLNVVP